MGQKINWKDNVYLAMPFVMMFILYRSSSMTYEDQSITSTLTLILKGEPFKNFLSTFHFTYSGQPVSIEALGYFKFVEFFLRKGAHFFSYFIIGFFWFLGLQKRVRHEWLTILLAVLLSMGYASFDELRQSFNPGRTALMADVLLDTAGAIVGVGMAKFLVYKKIIK